MEMQISHAVCAALIETFLSLMKEKGQPTAPSRTMQSESLLTATDAPRILKTSNPKAYGMMSRKETRSFFFDETVQVGREDLDAFIHEHLVD